MEIIKLMMENPVIFPIVAVSALMVYIGKKIFDELWKVTVSKFKAEPITRIECLAIRGQCDNHRHESLLWLKPELIKIKKFMHLVGTKVGVEEAKLAELINGDAREDKQ